MDGALPVGYLRVRVTSGGLAYPVEGAVVLIKGGTPEDSGVMWSGRTDSSGLTGEAALPAKDAELSESPGNDDPFMTYSVEIIKEGYYRSLVNEVRLFEGISATLPVNLVPLGEGDLPYGAGDSRGMR
ncbi:MAG: hypothetical protein IJQ80_03850 [Clostridia bacterium]|nr:hypothetical protein [Clostridia bacterium]